MNNFYRNKLNTGTSCKYFMYYWYVIHCNKSRDLSVTKIAMYRDLMGYVPKYRRVFFLIITVSYEKKMCPHSRSYVKAILKIIEKVEIT